jgi:hypothetical protein
MIDVEGPLSYSSPALSLLLNVHISARALSYINFIRFGYFARLSQCWGRGYFTRSDDFYLPSLRLDERGGGGQRPVAGGEGGGVAPPPTPFYREASRQIFEDDVNRFFLHLGHFFMPSPDCL